MIFDASVCSFVLLELKSQLECHAPFIDMLLASIEEVVFACAYVCAWVDLFVADYSIGTVLPFLLLC